VPKVNLFTVLAECERIIQIQEIFGSVERLLSQKRDTGLILARRNVLK